MDEQLNTLADTVPGHEWLYLFSSNQSPLYAQDILNVLAAPDGLHYTFRYDARYVEDATAAAWTGLAPGTHVLVVFSIQQKARFHPAAFLPVRIGELIDTYTVGSRYFVRFALRQLVSLPAPTPGDAATKHDRWVQSFTQELCQRLRDTPYEKSASLGAALPAATQPAPPWDTGSPADKAFEQSVDYLAQTETFAKARFYRVRRIAQTMEGTEPAVDQQGVLQLNAGNVYDLEILHAQRATPVQPERFIINADGVTLKVLGHDTFEVASRYDRLSLRLLATPAPGIETRETVLDIHPEVGVEGPSVTIPVSVVANKTKAIGIAGAQATALIAVALASTLTVFPLGVRIGLAVLGAITAAGLQLVGVAVLRSPAMPSTPRPVGDTTSASRAVPAQAER
jgi:hypothetical protein